jgi:hypothetical protein
VEYLKVTPAGGPRPVKGRGWGLSRSPLRDVRRSEYSEIGGFPVPPRRMDPSFVQVGFTMDHNFVVRS